MFLSCVSLFVVAAASNSGDGRNKHQRIITAALGHDVTLPCQAPTMSPIRAAEWCRPDLEPQYVFFFRDGQPDQTNQHPWFENRVDLADREMKDGNLSVVLKKVVGSDTGTYECRVKMQSTRRHVIKSAAVSVTNLMVTQAGQRTLLFVTGSILLSSIS